MTPLTALDLKVKEAKKVLEEAEIELFMAQFKEEGPLRLRLTLNMNVSAPVIIYPDGRWAVSDGTWTA